MPAKQHDFGAGLVNAHQHSNGGGWVADTATVSPSAWVGGTARVSGTAQVGGAARVGGTARVSGKARVGDTAQVRGDAWVGDKARVGGAAWVGGMAWVGDTARVGGTAITGYKPVAPVPIVPHIDAAILDALTSGGTLEMNDWHTCETTHCRAGWAIHLAGDPGRALEEECGPWLAGALIYQASRPEVALPDFFATKDNALADLKAAAGASESVDYGDPGDAQ
jgi:hypothetical protein